jgi:hypothetical protein
MTTQNQDLPLHLQQTQLSDYETTELTAFLTVLAIHIQVTSLILIV